MPLRLTVTTVTPTSPAPTAVTLNPARAPSPPARPSGRSTCAGRRHARRARLIFTIATLSVLGIVLPAAHPPTDTWVLPVGSRNGPVDVARGFDPPEQPWLAGHRGVDLRAPGGSEVRAAAAGQVVYAGLLAGRGVAVVRHGAIRTTYEPVDTSVSVGDEVAVGDRLGTVSSVGTHCPPESCLHWGAIEGDTYLDPLSLLSSADIRLLPLGDRTLTESEPPAQPDGPPDLEPPPTAGAKLRWPVADPRITSPFGTRVHPITGVRRLHDGTDFAAPCGTPIRASASGVVTHAGVQGPYGLQVRIDHGALGAVVISTSYSHLSGIQPTLDERVSAGDVVGWAGTTGLSTGCHLHFMTYADGRLTDPVRWLPESRHTAVGKLANRLDQ